MNRKIVKEKIGLIMNGLSMDKANFNSLLLKNDGLRGKNLQIMRP
jgi:hypothetical protein